MVYDVRTGAFCGAAVAASYNVPLPPGVPTPPDPATVSGGVPAQKVGTICLWLGTRDKSCSDIYTSPYGLQAEFGGPYGYPDGYVKPHYDSALGHMVDTNPCEPAHMTFSLYPGVELTANQCDDKGHQ